MKYKKGWFEMYSFTVSPIAYIHTDFTEKFGIPRQSGRAAALCGKIVFLPEYRTDDALRGIDGFSHLWLLFDFSLSHREKFGATVRPPRLGGNERIGVFASRSPFRPNHIGLSCVKLIKCEKTDNEGTVLHVSGVDLLDNTPILDIKPYLPFADCIPDASGGYADNFCDYKLDVKFPENLLEKIFPDKREALIQCLCDDPRPSYQNDPERIYSMSFDGKCVSFCVKGSVLTVVSVT